MTDHISYKEITVTVLNQTEHYLKETSELIGMPMGELIDRMSLNWSANTPLAAIQLILEDMVIHVKPLPYEQRRKVFAVVLSVIKKSLEKDDSEFIQNLLADIDV